VAEAPDRAARKVAARRAGRQAARRRDAAALLRVAEATCSYAARQLGDGLSAREARVAALETSAALAEVAAALRRAVRLPLPERRRLARQWAGRGSMSKREAAETLGVSDKTLYRYLAGGPGPAGRAERIEPR